MFTTEQTKLKESQREVEAVPDFDEAIEPMEEQPGSRGEGDIVGDEVAGDKGNEGGEIEGNKEVEVEKNLETSEITSEMVGAAASRTNSVSDQPPHVSAEADVGDPEAPADTDMTTAVTPAPIEIGEEAEKMETETSAPQSKIPPIRAPARPATPQSKAEPLPKKFSLCFVGNKYNPSNFW